MAGNEITHENLLDGYPGATSVQCDGKGFVMEYDNGGDRGGMGHCPACERSKLAGAVSAFTPPRFRRTVEVPAEVAEWAARGHQAEGLYLTGQVGTGKTHAAWLAVAAWCSATGVRPAASISRDREAGRGPSVIFTRMTDLLDDLRPGDDARQCVRDCQNAALLVLDDIGAEKASEWTQERLYSIIDHRYVHCRSLIVTSNLPASKLGEQTGERAASRLAEMCVVVPMTGDDRRKPGGVNPAEISDLLAFASGYGLPQPDQAGIRAWHEALHKLDFDEAHGALILHYQESAAHVMPADIWNRCRVPEPVAPVILLRPRPVRDPERWHRMWQDALTEHAAACESRRAVVLGARPPEDNGSPPLADRLCDPPLNFTRPGQWNGYVPPEMFNGGQNNSPRRAALLAIVDEALAASTEEDR